MRLMHSMRSVDHKCLTTAWNESSALCKSYRLREMIYQYLCTETNNTLCDPMVKAPYHRDELRQPEFWPMYILMLFAITLACIVYRRNVRRQRYLRL